MKKKLLIIGVALVILATTFVYGCGKGVATYNNFGFSFGYPAYMEIEEEGLLSSEANEESGIITLKNTKRVAMIEIVWGPKAEEVDKASLKKLLDDLLERHQILVKAKQEETVHTGHAVIEQRYIVLARFGFIRSTGIWWCDELEKTFQITATRTTKDAGVEVTATGGVKMPPVEKDPAYNDYRKILTSFHCH